MVGDIDGQLGIGELSQDAAEVAAIDPQRLDQLAGGGVAAGVDLVEHARFGEAQRAVGEVLVEQADLAGVEAVEGANVGDDGVSP